MPDIAMCRDVECPKRGACYRYVAFPSAQQSWGTYRYKSGCLFYWKIPAEKRARRVEAADIVNRGEAVEERA